MFKFLVILALALFQFSLLAQVNFDTQTIQETLPQAQQKQKLVFAVFSAEECRACKWMDSNVYTDSRLSSTINNELLPIKIDGYTIDGKREKYSHRVNILPTMIFFDENGNEVRRIEGKKTLEEMNMIVSEVLAANCTSLDEKLNKGLGTRRGSVCCEGLVEKKREDDGVVCVKRLCVETGEMNTVPKGETSRTGLPCCDDSAVRKIILNSRATKIQCVDVANAVEINHNPRANVKVILPISNEKKKAGPKATAE